jgi:spore germination protein PB
MNLYISQSIVIHNLRVGGVSNSAVLQIGSAGLIKTQSHLYNTGGFTGPVPHLTPPETALIPLPPPVEVPL